MWQLRNGGYDVNNNNVTGFEKTQLPHARSIKLMILPEIHFVMSLVSVAAFLTPCVSVEWCFGTMHLDGHGSLVFGAQRAGQAANVCYLQFGVL